MVLYMMETPKDRRQVHIDVNYADWAKLRRKLFAKGETLIGWLRRKIAEELAKDE